MTNPVERIDEITHPEGPTHGLAVDSLTGAAPRRRMPTFASKPIWMTCGSRFRPGLVTSSGGRVS